MWNFRIQSYYHEFEENMNSDNIAFIELGDALSRLLFNFALEYVIREVQETNLEWDMYSNQQVLPYEVEVNFIRRYYLNNRNQYRCNIKCFQGYWFSSKLRKTKDMEVGRHRGTMAN